MANISDMEEISRKLKKRKKLCHNCEGDIDLEVIVCPFCAADLREEKPEQDSLSFYSPSSRAFNAQTAQSLYPSASSPSPSSDAAPESSSQSSASEEEPKNVFVPTIFFTLGVQLVLLGLLMLLFSHHGTVTLKWDASWWFMYCLAGAPLLYLGYRAFSKI